MIFQGKKSYLELL